MEAAHFSFDAAGIAFAAAGDGAAGGDFAQEAIEPGLAVLRGE